MLHLKNAFTVTENKQIILQVVVQNMIKTVQTFHNALYLPSESCSKTPPKVLQYNLQYACSYLYLQNLNIMGY